jgi:murein DD-endopeptidase MepM/ murein hydrolase activator NlpD
MWRAFRSPALSSVVLVVLAGAVPATAAGTTREAVGGGGVTAVGSTAEAVGGGGVVLGAPAARGATSRARWGWPTASHVVLRPWAAPESEYGPGHRGLDVAAAPHTPVVAVAAGTVTFAGPVGGRPVLTVEHGGGLVSTLDAVDPTVVPGDHVEQGDPVGTAVAGHCDPDEPCVHIGARLDGRYVDPAAYLPRAAWPVLLPDGTGVSTGRSVAGPPRPADRAGRRQARGCAVR